VTELDRNQKELRLKEQMSNELAEKCELLLNFFETCPVNMGIVQNDTSELDWTNTIVVSCNPATAATYGTYGH
jgi:hypothetical protein